MGKKNLKKYKQKKNINQENYEEKVVEKDMPGMIFKDIQTTIDKLKSPELDSRDYFTTIISTYQFRDANESTIKNFYFPRGYRLYQVY